MIHGNVGRRIVVLFGPPGCGKGTYASALCRVLGFSHVAVGDAVRHEIKQGTTIGNQLKAHSNAGTLAPDEIITELLHTQLMNHAGAKDLVLEGYPRNQVVVVLCCCFPVVASRGTLWGTLRGREAL